jgi:hypothetical protein
MLASLVAAAVLQTGLTPLSRTEISWLLDGVRIDYADIVLVSGAQYYWSDGRYTIPARVLVQGTWRAEHGRLCRRSLERPAAETCIILLTDGRGGFFGANSDADLSDGKTFTVRFVPQLTQR